MRDNPLAGAIRVHKLVASMVLQACGCGWAPNDLLSGRRAPPRWQSWIPKVPQTRVDMLSVKENEEIQRRPPDAINLSAMPARSHATAKCLIQ